MTTNTPAQKTRKVDAIDGLRAIAVLSIFLFHVNPKWLPGGFVGVDIFFVISGFVVALSVRNVRFEKFGTYLSWFYRRRIARIYPALMVMLALGFLVWALIIPDGYVGSDITRVGYGAFLGLSNVVLFVKTGDYFGTFSEFNLFTHTWSLGVEEQYYFLFPLISFVVLVSSARSAKSRVRMDAAVLVITLLSLLLCAVANRVNQTFAFYMIPTRFWELALGFMLANCEMRPRGSGLFGHVHIPRWGQSLNAAFMLLMVAALIWTPEDQFPFPGALLPVVATAGLLLMAFREEGGTFNRLLSNRVVVWFGQISYSLYLWHWVVIVALRWTVGMETLLAQCVAIALSLLLAVASYYYVEKPIRYSKKILALNDRRFFIGFAAAMALTVGFAVSLQLAKPRISLTVSADHEVWSPYTNPPLSKDGCPVTRVRHYDAKPGFHLNYEPQNCTKPQPQRLFALGDSHAGAYHRLYGHLAMDTGRTVEVLTYENCKPLQHFDSNLKADCGEFLERALALVSTASKPGDILFLPGLYMKRYRDGWSEPIVKTENMDLAPSTEDTKAADAGFALLKPLIDKGLHVVIEAPKPLTSNAQYRCADWFTRNNPYCLEGEPTRLEMQQRKTRVEHYLRDIASKSPLISVWDPFEVLCPGPVCGGYLDGKPLYNDGDHLSGYANDLLFPSLRDHLRSITQPQ